MDIFNNIPKILVITGVSFETLKYRQATAPPQVSVYEPSKFETFWKPGDTTPEAELLDQRCPICFCCLNDIDFKIFIPESMEKITHRFRKLGNIRFDNFMCAASYIKHFLKNDVRYKMLLAKLYNVRHPVAEPVIEITPALPTHLMKPFGGSWTHAEWVAASSENFEQFLQTMAREDRINPEN